MPKTNLNYFLFKQEQRNLWINERYIKIYVRRSYRYITELGIGNERLSTLCISNIIVNNRKRGKGIFTKFLKRAIKAAIYANCEVIYIENVLNLRFQKFFDRKPTWHHFDKKISFGKSYCKDLRGLK